MCTSLKHPRSDNSIKPSCVWKRFRFRFQVVWTGRQHQQVCLIPSTWLNSFVQSNYISQNIHSKCQSVRHAKSFLHLSSGHLICHLIKRDLESIRVNSYFTLYSNLKTRTYIQVIPCIKLKLLQLLKWRRQPDFLFSEAPMDHHNPSWFLYSRFP